MSAHQILVLTSGRDVEFEDRLGTKPPSSSAVPSSSQRVAVRFIHNAHELGRAMGEARVDALVVASEFDDLPLESLLNALCLQLPNANLFFSLTDARKAARLVRQFGGQILARPVGIDAILGLLSQPGPPKSSAPRSAPRRRVSVEAFVESHDHKFPATLVNLSGRGALVMSRAPNRVGNIISIRLPIGDQEIILAGTIRHGEQLASADSVGADEEWLLTSHPTLAGVEFFEQSRAAAQTLLKLTRDERLFTNLLVMCVPGIPKGLTQIFRRHGCTVECLPRLPARVKNRPSLLLIDFSICGREELRQLESLQRRMLVIGFSSRPLVEPLAIRLALEMPEFFVLPGQSEMLVLAMNSFLAPIHRRFPKLGLPFTALLEMPGQRRQSVDGASLLLNGCSILADGPVPTSVPMQGLLNIEGTVTPYAFQGEAVYCIRQGKRYRVGLNFQIAEAAFPAYLKNLSAYFHRDLAARWEANLRNVASPA